MDMGTEEHSFNCLTEIEEAIHLSDEDFLNIEDLSEFSDEDIAAPIIGSSSSSLVSMTQNKGNLTPSTTEDSISKSSCTVAPITAIAATHTQDCRTSEAIRSKNAGLLPGHEDPGFDWLSSFSEETALIYGASSFGVEFLDNCDSTAFEYAAIGSTQHERYNGVAKIFIGDAAHEKLGSNESGRTISTHSHSYCGNMGRLSCKERDTSLPNTNLLPLPAKARSKRPRSATKAWTSAMLWGNASSPTESLESGLSYLKPDMCTLSSLHMSNGMCKDDFKVDVPISLKEGLSYGGDELYSYPFDDKRCRKVGKHAKAPKKRFVEHAGHGQDAVVAYDDDEEYNGDEHTEGALSQKEAPTRRCTHCLSNKTPQWRAGPLGPKTLCNACGVRYKSGRLFDEYRPAKSPTFLSFKHSNSHKKVIEMRRRKGLDASPSINQAYKRYQNSQCPKSSHNGSISSTSSASTMAPLLPSPSPSSSSSSSMKLNIKLSPSTKSQANPAEVTLITTPDVNFFY